MQNAGRTTVAAFAALVATGGTGLADDTHAMTLLPNADAVAWAPGPASLPKGTQLVVLAGDPGQAGPFVLRVKFPPSSVVAPHGHATAENLTVLSGSVFHAMGDKLDRSSGEEMAAGGFVYLPARTNHSVWTTTSEARCSW